MLLVSLVASTSFVVVAPHEPAGADQLSSLRAQAAAISQQLIQQQLEVDTYRQRYSVVSAQVAADNQAIAQIGQQIDQDTQQIAAKVALVKSQAVRSYMDYGTGSGSTTASLFAGNQGHTPGGQRGQRPSPWATSPRPSTSSTPLRTQLQSPPGLPPPAAGPGPSRPGQPGGAPSARPMPAPVTWPPSTARSTGQLADRGGRPGRHPQQAAAVAAVAAAQKQAAKSAPARPDRGTAGNATVPTIPATLHAGNHDGFSAGHPSVGAGADLPDPPSTRSCSASSNGSRAATTASTPATATTAPSNSVS